MRPEDLVFWLDVLSNVDGVASGGLCLRHADAMVVPRNWTLDDHRDPDLHLFRPPSGTVRRRPNARRSARPAAASEQLELGVEPSAAEPAGDDGPVVADGEVTAGADATEVAEDVDSWTPTFDDADDLDGLLSARSPLLARAFRGDDRPKS